MRPHLPALVAVLAASCASDQAARSDLAVPPAQDPTAAPNRPHDPWVFRCVLEGNARMLTVALSDRLWVAFDVHHGQLYRAWSGGVELTGAVYDSLHGPQPVPTGDAYLAYADYVPAGPGEMPDPPGEGFRFEDGTPAELVWRGHRFRDGRVSLHWTLEAADRTPEPGGRGDVEIAVTPVEVPKLEAGDIEVPGPLLQLELLVEGIDPDDSLLWDIPPSLEEEVVMLLEGGFQNTAGGWSLVVPEGQSRYMVEMRLPSEAEAGR